MTSVQVVGDEFGKDGLLMIRTSDGQWHNTPIFNPYHSNKVVANLGPRRSDVQKARHRIGGRRTR